MITRRFLPAQFQPVQRRFPRHRCAGLARARQLPRQHRQHRIVPQLVVVIEVLIPERNPKHPLADQGGHRVLDQILTAMIAKAGRKSIHQIDRSIGRAKKQPTRIRRHQPRIKSRFHSTAFHHSKIKLFCATLCWHRGAPRHRKVLLAKELSLIRRLDALKAVRNAG